MDREQWEHKVTNIMRQVYGLEWEDFMERMGEEDHESFTPSEWVEWYGEKYDLTENDF